MTKQSKPLRRKPRPKVLNEIIDIDGNVLYSCVSKLEATRVFKLACQLCPGAYFGLIQRLQTRFGGTLDVPDHSLFDPTDVGTKECK